MRTSTKMCIHASHSLDGKVAYTLFGCDMSQYGYILIGETDVEFEVPDDFDLVNAEIAGLKKQKAGIQAETQVKINAIDDKIQRLLCIEHKPDAAPEGDIVDAEFSPAHGE